MAGLGICLFTDEHIFKGLARELRNRGYNAEGCHEAGRANLKISDDEQLAYATRADRALLTENVVDFLHIDIAWKSAGREHAGIILVRNVGQLGELLRRVERHLNTVPPSVQHDTLLWLDSGPSR